MTRLLFDGRLMLDGPTGIGRYIASLVPELVQAAPRWQFHLLTGERVWAGYGLEKLIAPNLTRHVRPWRHMHPRQYYQIPRLARALGVDLVHYPHFDAPVLVGGIPVVATFHDAKYLLRPDFFPRLSVAKRLYMRLAFALTLRRAAGVLADSESTARDLGHLFGTPRERITVALLATDPNFRPALPVAVSGFRQQYGLMRPYILSVGELRPHKNHATLIEAYATVASNATLDLVIIGRPYEGHQATLSALVRAHDLTERVHILTDVGQDALVAAYTGADLFVLVSHYEGFGLPVLEAMACGVPVVASQTTSLGEVTGAGGLVVNPDDPAAIAEVIDNVLSDTQVRRDLVAQGYEWQRRFTWQATAAATLGVYQRILNSG